VRNRPSNAKAVNCAAAIQDDWFCSGHAHCQSGSPRFPGSRGCELDAAD
jgi:hypothetical protein